MEEFERLLCDCKGALERFLHFRIGNRQDAEDLFQETCVSAWKHFAELRDLSAFRAWIIGIARNRCNDYYRAKAREPEIRSLDAVFTSVSPVGRMGMTERTLVCETLAKLTENDRQILDLYYRRELSQKEIAARLGIPEGTVKSRLHGAKTRFRQLYPYPPQTKGEIHMKQLPEKIPVYKITPSGDAPFPVVWEELMGWFLIPRLGEKLNWGMYEFPSGKRTEWDEMRVLGKAEVHGIAGVEVSAVAHTPMECNSEGGMETVERRFVAQLTDTHCRYLAESHVRDGIRHYYTFLDGDAFVNNWGFGENNCGNETHLQRRGTICRDGNRITCAEQPFLLDIVGRYTVEIGGKRYDTVCVMDVETYNEGVASEQFLDRNGRTVLWRRFNHNQWRIGEGEKPWSEQLPENERIEINGTAYVHWYDCITDYIL